MSDASLTDLVRRHFSDCDLVVIEGYRGLPIPKIEVTRSGAARPPVPDALARVSDHPSEDAVPTFSFEDRDGIIAALLRIAGLDRAASVRSDR
jgi:molybdopterin-guanine dinucleotide biosynthesis protein